MQGDTSPEGLLRESSMSIAAMEKTPTRPSDLCRVIVQRDISRVHYSTYMDTLNEFLTAFLSFAKSR